MCTAVRFVDGEDNMFFGRNLDWSFSYGEKVLYTPKDYNYQPVFNGEDRNHAVLGIGIVVDDTPLYFDCANDAGLAVAGLNFPGYAEYASDSVNLTVNVAAYEFPLWVARNFTSVDDVAEALKNVQSWRSPSTTSTRLRCSTGSSPTRRAASSSNTRQAACTSTTTTSTS